jgi:cytoskeleton-associated protein 5
VAFHVAVFSRAQADANGSSQIGVKTSSAASLLSGKRPVSAIPKKSSTASTKSGAKKTDGSSASAKSQAEAPEDVEPGEMSLEDIETRLGALFEPEVMANLKSANWKERLEAITSLKDSVEGLETLDQYAELLIRLLCILPGWNEKNIQVQQKAIEAVVLIAQNATRFSKKCVVLCLTGVVEKVGDIKTRIQATKCLTTFCEAVGPKFVFERLFKIMKDHKNPKVLSEGLSWMITALDDFGIGHVPLKDLINFCKDTGLGSSAAAVRTATIKLFGVLHKFVGPGSYSCGLTAYCLFFLPRLCFSLSFSF